MVSKKDREVEDRLMFLADCAVNEHIPENPKVLREKLQQYMGEDYGEHWNFERQQLSVGRLLAWPFHALAAPGIVAFALAGSAINAVARKLTKKELFDLSWLDRAPPFEREDGSSVFSITETVTDLHERKVSKMSDSELNRFFSQREAAEEFDKEIWNFMPSTETLKMLKGVNWERSEELVKDSVLRHYGHDAQHQYLAEKWGDPIASTGENLSTDESFGYQEREGVLRLMDLQQKFCDYPCYLDALKKYVEDGVDMKKVADPRDVFVSYLKESYAEGAKRNTKMNPLPNPSHTEENSHKNQREASEKATEKPRQVSKQSEGNRTIQKELARHELLYLGGDGPVQTTRKNKTSKAPPKGHER